MIARAGAVVLLGALVLGSGANSGQDQSGHSQSIDEPELYRSENYRAPTPSTLRGARVVSTFEAEAIWKLGSAVFVDVLPQIARPPDLPAGTLWRGQRRLNIPGSIWLPDTGYGDLAPAKEDYLKAGLERVTGSDHNKPVVIYCLRDCWMSWNAAKRAVAWGYTNVIWYPDGTDGWQEAELPVEEAVPARIGE
jgi:PQQ-dependent catabolism-associated CXXCW motif protein